MIDLRLVLIATLAGPAYAAGTGLIIDDFDAALNDDAGGIRIFSSRGIPPLYGGRRFDVDPTASFAGDTGLLIFESGFGDAHSGTLTWLGEDTDGDGFGNGIGLNADALSLSRFEVDFIAADQDFRLSMVMTSGSTGVAFTNESLTVTAQNLADGVTTYGFDFTQFDLTDFDTSNINRITLQVNFGRETGLDFGVTEFRAVVPTPGSAALLAMGGLIGARRRR